MKKINVVMGMPNKDLQGGPAGHLPFLVEGLENLDINVIQTAYGSRKNIKTLRSRVLDFTGTITSLRKILLTNNIDIIHLNSAFDFKALLRDFTILFFLRSYKTKNGIYY